MRYLPFKHFVAGMAVFVAGCVGVLAQTPSLSGIGRAPTEEELSVLNKAGGPSGKDLPPGKGTAKQGALIYMVKCAMCHGRDGEGVRWAPGAFSPISGPRLGGGNSVPLYFSNRPAGRITTMAYSVPFTAAIFNTIAVEMPLFRAGTLTSDEVYNLTAYMLFKNGLIQEDEVMDRDTLPKVPMPNRNDFPATDDIYMDMQKRGCIKTYGMCRDR